MASVQRWEGISNQRARTNAGILLATVHIRAGERDGLQLVHGAIAGVTKLSSVRTRQQYLTPLAVTLEARPGADAKQLARTARQVAAAQAQLCLHADQLVPFLDGLDEVAKEHQQACAAAINDFHAEKGATRLLPGALWVASSAAAVAGVLLGLSEGLVTGLIYGVVTAVAVLTAVILCLGDTQPDRQSSHAEWLACGVGGGGGGGARDADLAWPAGGRVPGPMASDSPLCWPSAPRCSPWCGSTDSG